LESTFKDQINPNLKRQTAFPLMGTTGTGPRVVKAKPDAETAPLPPAGVLPSTYHPAQHMVGLIPRLLLLLPAMLHWHSGRPGALGTFPFHCQCDGEAGPAGSSLRVALASGVSQRSPGFRSGGLTLVPSLPWGHTGAGKWRAHCLAAAT
jgi:hypothetical protein